MMRFGTRFCVSVAGSSHGPNVRGTVSGLRKGVAIDLSAVQRELDRRRPVGRRLATRRLERDLLVVDEGLRRGRTTGRTIRFHVANEDVQRAPYDKLREIPRPGHADYPARIRYGPKADLSGGGIFSGRMTIPLVVAGALAQQMLRPIGVEVAAFTRTIATTESPEMPVLGPDEIRRRVLSHESGALDDPSSTAMEKAILRARSAGDSVGGIIETRVFGLPVGIGEPFFDSVESELAHLAFSIPGVKGVEFGAGFAATRMRGSEHNDAWFWDGGQVRSRTNHAGGALGGLTTGAPLIFRIAVKPTASIAHPQESVNMSTHQPVRLVVPGRHDPCIVPRAVVVAEAVAAIVVYDLWLRREASN